MGDESTDQTGERELRSARITVMLTPKEKQRLRRYAERHGRSLSNAAALLVERGLEQYEG